MADILNITGLGKLEIVETYIYYDQPVLFSCKSAAGHLYLGVAGDKNDEHETWLYVGVSAERLSLIRSGAIDLHDAFAEPEDSFLLREIVPYDDQTEPWMEPIQPDRISEDMLPMPGECLDLETETLPALRNSEEIAVSRKQEILNLTLNFEGLRRTEAPVTVLSQMLGKFQEVINTIGMIHDGKKQVTEKIRSSMQTSLLEVGAGSFDIRLVSTETVDLFNHSDCGNAIEEFLKLLDAANNQDQLKGLLERLTSRVAKNYTQFLKSLSESVIDTKFTWTSPDPDRGGSAYLSKPQMQEVIDILQKFQEETPFTSEITGTLIGASLKSKRFELETTNEIYAGRITDEAIETVRNATLSQTYTAEIQEITERSETTDETKTKYQLLSLSDKQ